jgi:voltage-gated potassium channel
MSSPTLQRAYSRGHRLLATRFRLPALLVALAFAYGIVGYKVLWSWSWLDSVYMTVITLSTVGFGEVNPLTPGGRVFTITLILFGIVALFDLLAAVAATLASGELGVALRRRTMRRVMDDLREHFVICAYGRVGRAAAEEFLAQGADVVVIEVKPELVPPLAEAGIAHIMADPTEESVLLQAGIARAKGLVCAVDSDAINVYITLTARSLNPDLFIVARASSPDSVDKLERAGANRIVSPYTLSGVRMAALALQPSVVEFVDAVRVAPDLRLEEILVSEGSGLASSSLGEVCSRSQDVVVLAVKKAQGDLLVSPRQDEVLAPGDLVIALGRADALSRFV